MQRTPALIGAGLLIVIVAVFLIVGSGGGDDSTTTTASTSAGGSTSGDTTTADSRVQTIVIKDGQPVGGVADLTFTEGEDIRFIVKSDVSDEVHFHGYDVGMDVEAGGQVEFDVPATITGVFEVELEQRVVPIASITVNPS
jgi:hypothetical protein